MLLGLGRKRCKRGEDLLMHSHSGGMDGWMGGWMSYSPHCADGSWFIVVYRYPNVKHHSWIA